MFCRRLWGCQVELRFSAIALLAFCGVFARAGSAAFFLAALLHEGGHLLAMVLLGAPPKALCLSAMGSRITPDPARPLGVGESIAVSLAGPLANLICFGLFWLLGRGEGSFAPANLILGIFQLLPIAPLDGGLALETWLHAVLGPDRTDRVTLTISLLLLLPLGVLGFLVLLRSRGNFTLLALSLYLLCTLLLGRELFPA